MSNAKVNPFYIQDDEEDPWDDDEDNYDDYDYDDEQVMLMSGSGGIKNRKYNANSNEAFQRRQQQLNSNNSHYSRSYHNSQYSMHNSHLEHKPQIWKYGFLLVTILGLTIFGTSVSSDNEKHSNNNFSLSSLIDEIPNKDISHDDYRIIVLGERHSGTAWMRERLRECFPHVEVSNHLQRMGYFFQDDEATARSKAEESEALATLHHSNTTTIVVHVTLNVYDWLEQMRLSPEYAPDHAGKHEELNHPVPLGWKEFLQKPWTTERPKEDLDMMNATGPVCQMGFEYNEVVSCSNMVQGIDDPMYELYENGQPFGSIIELRTAKLQNHHGVLESWPSVQKMIQVSYESTAKDFKTKLLHEILEFTGWSADLPCSGSVLPPSLERSKDMTIEFVDFVSERADWEIEQKIASYSQWTEEDMRSKKIRSEADSADNTQDNADSPMEAAEGSSTNEISEKQPETEESIESDKEEVEDLESDSETTDNDAANGDSQEDTTADESQTESTNNDIEENESVEAVIKEDGSSQNAKSGADNDSETDSSSTAPDEKADEEAPSTEDVVEESTVTEDGEEKDDSPHKEDKEVEEDESNVLAEGDASSSNAEETKNESETEGTNSEEEENTTEKASSEENKDGER